MSVQFFWQLPASGDGRLGDARVKLRGERRPGDGSPIQKGVSDPRGKSFNYFDYLHQVARAAELSTFDGVRIQHDPRGDESWIVTGYIARGTRSLKLITEFESSWGSAVYAAKNAVSVQRYTGGRMAWQLSQGTNETERRRNADPVGDPDILSRIEEFITVARGVIGSSPYSFKGRFFEVREGGFKGTLANHPPPDVYLSGATPEAHELSARLATVHVLTSGAPEVLREHIEDLRAREARHSRERNGALELGVRIDLLVRETAAEAQSDAERFAAQTHTRNIPDVNAGIWEGLTTSTSGAAATIVASYEQAAERLASYADLGISHFLLGAVPHLEEAYRIGAHVLPAVRKRLGAKSAA